jgi:hypothetical protein
MPEPRDRPLISRSCVVKPCFGHIPSIQQSKKDVFITVIFYIFTIFYGSSEKCKALHSQLYVGVNSKFFTFALLKVWNWAITGSFTLLLIYRLWAQQ